MKNIQDTPVIEVWHNDSDQVLAYRRKNNIFVFNFNPTRSFTDYGFLVFTEHTRLFSIPMQKEFGGFGLADDSIRHLTNFDPLYKREGKRMVETVYSGSFSSGFEKSERIILYE